MGSFGDADAKTPVVDDRRATARERVVVSGNMVVDGGLEEEVGGC
jgi:hypothetical protein